MARVRVPFLLLAAAAGAVVLVPGGPTGAGARPTPRGAAAAQAEDVRCEDAQNLAATERATVAGSLTEPGQAVRYEVRIEKLVGDACKPHKSCPDLGEDVAALRAERGDALSSGDEAELAAAEDAFVRKHCSS